MNVIGEFKCKKCGWVHFGISQADAKAEVDSFNEYFATLTAAEQQDFGGKCASLERYKKCFRCGSPSADFLPAEPGDCPDGCTIQPIIAPPTVKSL